MKKNLFIQFKYALMLLLAVSVFSGCEKLAESRDLDIGAEGLSGSITRFAVKGNYLYALNPNGVLTYDVSNANKPVLTHILETDYGLETITIYDGYVYVGSTSFLYILDISMASQPKLLSKSEGGLVVGGGCDPVVVKGNYAFSTIKTIQNICGNISSTSALLVFDVTNKSNPQLLGTYPLNMPNGLGYSGNFLFICDEGLDNVVVYNISNPADVQMTSILVPVVDPVDLIVNGSRMIVSSKTNFYIYDISNINDIKKLATVEK